MHYVLWWLVCFYSSHIKNNIYVELIFWHMKTSGDCCCPTLAVWATKRPQLHMFGVKQRDSHKTNAEEGFKLEIVNDERYTHYRPWLKYYEILQFQFPSTTNIYSSHCRFVIRSIFCLLAYSSIANTASKMWPLKESVLTWQEIILTPIYSNFPNNWGSIL